MLTKTKSIEQIEKFPEGFSIDELVERLILIEKVELGLKQSENGEIISDSCSIFYVDESEYGKYVSTISL